MKKILLTITLSVCYLNAYSQLGWERISRTGSKGDTTTNTDPSRPYADKDYDYGSESNPAPRINAVTWADPKGYLWLFGGSGVNEKYRWGIFRDMWKYDPLLNSWELVKGIANNAQFLVEQEADTQLPRPRKNATSWINKDGILWLYGGRNLMDLSHLDDMWRFDPDQNIWAKVIGSETKNQKPNYGTVKESKSEISPGSRSASANWVDNDGNLWLFGGLSYQEGDSAKASYFNDLWKFNTTSKQWTWISGSDKANQATATKKTGKSQQINPISPSPRSQAACWFDQKTDQLYLYGGFGYDSTATHFGGLSDMWSYSIKSGEWTLKTRFVKLNQDLEVSFIGSPDNSPGFRISPVNWSNQDGNFYLTGGHNKWGNITFVDTRLWKYNVADNIWESVSIQSRSSIIGAGASFNDEKGSTYIFGGEELDPKLYISRPTNSIWKLSL